MEIQAQIPAVLCAMHHYIHLYDPGDDNLPTDDRDNEYSFLEDGLDADVVMEDDVAAIQKENDDEFCQGAAMHDHIAAVMWTQYQRVVLQCSLKELNIMDSTEDKDATECC